MNPSRDKNAKARTLVGRGEKSLLSDLGSELRLRGSRTRRAKIINGMEKKKKKEARKIPVDFSQTPNM